MKPEPLDDGLRKDPRALIKAFHLKPKKSLGQNFLVSPAGIEKVIRAAELSGEDDVLEIGAGLGTLSLALADSSKHVVVIELDTDLIPALTWVLADSPNVEVVHGDILTMELCDLGLHQHYAVVANIPYNITSRLVRKLLESSFPADRVVLTIQDEVARRMVAAPGEMNLLALGVQAYGQPVIQAAIPAEAFFPQPKVDSAVIRIDRFPVPRLSPEQLNPFFDLARAGFSQRRKQLPNALSRGLGLTKDEVRSMLEESQIPPPSRAQELTLEDWIRLADQYRISY